MEIQKKILKDDIFLEEGIKKIRIKQERSLQNKGKKVSLKKDM